MRQVMLAAAVAGTADEEVVIRHAPRYRGGCGPNHFWEGSACVDVRFRC
jgi:hypothetical protein